jgi:hypothetical protein
MMNRITKGDFSLLSDIDLLAAAGDWNDILTDPECGAFGRMVADEVVTLATGELRARSAGTRPYRTVSDYEGFYEGSPPADERP